ncbi:hypothetical protein GCM10023211_09340 [Orbus sasakiae]|uniref:Toxin SymE-like domain-containing protein n=1 Tax=Orbus sasakiae TaxID=1078475 RepID=A0ABP9N2R1_9GAMM
MCLGCDYSLNVHHELKAAKTCTHYSTYPAFDLKANWLEQAGFINRQAVTITAKKGKLIVKIAKQIA